jgi:hypothetical protein
MMFKRWTGILLQWALVLSMGAACGSAAPVVSVGAVVTAGGTAATTTAAATPAAATSGNGASYKAARNYTWDAGTATSIVLDGGSIQVQGAGVTVNGSTAAITAAGTYVLSGSLSDGQIRVDTPDQEDVVLVSNGAEVFCSTSSPLYVVQAQDVILILAGGTENVWVDGNQYVLADPSSDEPNAAIFSTADLTITGEGSLSVGGNYNDGIASKDSLVIASGTIQVSAVDDGLRGKDELVIESATVTVDAGGDGLKADNSEETERGYILVQGGMVTVRAGADGLDAVSNVWIQGGSLSLTATDDAVHSTGSIVIDGGEIQVACGDDAMHADATLEINGGTIDVSRSYEGLESANITLNGGEIHVVASDDGINISSGVDGSGQMQGPGRGTRPGQDSFSSTGGGVLRINGGYVYVDADGDGLDVNGAIVMTGGVVLVNGPTNNGNGSIDYDQGFSISGGFLLTAGSAGMAMAPDTSSSQYALLINLSATQRAGTLVNIRTSTGEEVVTFAPSKNYASVTFSSSELARNTGYMVSLGGQSSGTATDALYEGGTFSGGTAYTNVTISSIITAVGGQTRMR